MHGTSLAYFYLLFGMDMMNDRIEETLPTVQDYHNMKPNACEH